LTPFTEIAHEVADLATGTIDTYLAQVDTDFLESVQCKLYCALKAAGTYSTDIVLAWAQDIEDDAGLLLGQRLWGRFAKLYTPAEITKRFSVGGEVPNDDCETLCSDCPTEECALSNWSVYPSDGGFFGTITDVNETDGILSVTCGNRNTDGSFYVLIQTDDDNHCCQYLGLNNDVHPTGFAVIDCGGTRGTGTYHGGASGDCVNTILFSSPAEFAVEIIMSPCS